MNVYLVPSYDGGPEIWLDEKPRRIRKFRLDEQTAVYWQKILTDYIYSTVHKGVPSNAPFLVEEKTEAA